MKIDTVSSICGAGGGNLQAESRRDLKSLLVTEPTQAAKNAGKACKLVGERARHSS